MNKSAAASALENFDFEYERIITAYLPSLRTSAPKNSHVITQFLHEYTTLCQVVSPDIDLKTRFTVLSQLKTLCVEILTAFKCELKSFEAIKACLAREKNRDSRDPESIDISGIIESLYNLKHVKDVTELEDSSSFYYYTIVEFYILINNNLAYTCLEQENFDLAIELIMNGVECWRLLECSSYYLKYQISTLLINLVSLVEEENKLEGSQLLCNIALHLESLEMEIDHNTEHIQIYGHIQERAPEFMFLLR